MIQPIQDICPSCGKTDKTLWPEGCNNVWHREEWERLQQENANQRAHIARLRAILIGDTREETAENIFSSSKGRLNSRSVYILADELFSSRAK